MAFSAGSRPGNRIARVEIHEFTYEVEGLGLDASGNRCVMRGGRSQVPGFALAIETADGARGEYCTSHSGKSGVIVGQARMLAQHVIGMDAFAREAVFNKLADGGHTVMPFAQTFWSERFGMCTDKFGCAWAVNAGVMEVPK